MNKITQGMQLCNNKWSCTKKMLQYTVVVRT